MEALKAVGRGVGQGAQYLSTFTGAIGAGLVTVGSGEETSRAVHHFNQSKSDAGLDTVSGYYLSKSFGETVFYGSCVVYAAGRGLEWLCTPAKRGGEDENLLNQHQTHV